MSQPSRLIPNYSQSKQRVRPQAVTFAYLCESIYATIRKTAPSFVPTPSIERRIHDLFWLCPPDLAHRCPPFPHECPRWLLPGPFQRLAHELGQEVGAQVVKEQ